MFYIETTKEQIKAKVNSTIHGSGLLDVYRLEDATTVLVQLEFKYGIALNCLLELGIILYNPRISANDKGNTLCTFLMHKHVEDGF